METSSAERPTLAATLETVLYHRTSEAAAMHAFYSDVLGLDEVSRWRDGVCFRLGAGVVILFDRDQTAERPDPSTRHGASGAVHACFLADSGRYDAWKRHLAAAGIAYDETTWRSGERSLFFRDPAGNLLEIAERDLWPRT